MELCTRECSLKSIKRNVATVACVLCERKFHCSCLGLPEEASAVRGLYLCQVCVADIRELQLVTRHHREREERFAALEALVTSLKARLDRLDPGDTMAHAEPAASIPESVRGSKSRPKKRQRVDEESTRTSKLNAMDPCKVMVQDCAVVSAKVPIKVNMLDEGSTRSSELNAMDSCKGAVQDCAATPANIPLKVKILDEESTRTPKFNAKDSCKGAVQDCAVTPANIPLKVKILDEESTRTPKFNAKDSCKVVVRDCEALPVDVPLKCHVGNDVDEMLDEGDAQIPVLSIAEENTKDVISPTRSEPRCMSTDSFVGQPYDDNYLYCDDCNKEHFGNCDIHGPMVRIHDTLVANGDPLKADHSVPWGFEVAPSSIPGAGLGVWTRFIEVPKGTVFGPYEGKVVTLDSAEALSSDYCWQIHGPLEPSHCIDGQDVAVANWLRYVNCANNPKQQNLVAFQYKRHIFYRSTKYIGKDSELFVFYGREYAKVLCLDSASTKSKTVKTEAPAKRRCVALKVAGQKMKLSPSTSSDEPRAILKPPAEPGSNEFTIKTTLDSSHTKNLKCIGQVYVSPEAKDDSPRPYICPECNYAQKTFAHMKEHLFNRHSITLSYNCKECEAFFLNGRDLKTHQKATGHAKSEIQFIDCATASLGSPNTDPNKESRQSLPAGTTPERPYPCPDCDFAAKKKSSLHVHQRHTHRAQIVYECQKCAVQYKEYKKLRQHQLAESHKGIKKLVG